MAARLKLSEDDVQSLKTAMAQARDKAEYQRALCVWLPLALGITHAQVATALGWPLRSVDVVRNRYRRQGARAFQDLRQPPLAGSPADAWGAALQQARTPADLRRVLCVWLRLFLGLTQRQVAVALGCPLEAVRKAQQAYRKGGMAAVGPRGRAPSGDAAPEIQAAMKRARSAADHRRALCLFLRVVLGLGPGEVAEIVGWKPESVCRFQRQYLSRGAAVFDNPGRGGARRGILTLDQQNELLAGLRHSREEGWPLGFMRITVIHEAMEKVAGRRLKTSSVLSFLDRHGWIPAALVVTPVQSPKPKEE
ncbi:MAG TPA: helix-turn-helix domain-containing protein [Terriglobia bacterium]|nr:helix-turn-helix domain-containing protein [Terriglobia bacterium]